LNDLYYIAGKSYDFEVFNRNLDFVKTLRVDTFIVYIKSLLLIDTNKIALICHNPEVGNNYHKSIVVKIIDTIGHDYHYFEIDAPDTIATPGPGTMISQSNDSNYLFFTWIKNDWYMTSCNNNEPSYIGVGKFDNSLNPKWIKYFGNDTAN